MAHIDARIEEITQGRVVLSAPITEKVGQQHGAAHAGVTFALGDSASGYAALTQMPQGSEVMTVEMKINLLAPARGSRLWASGEVVRAGRRIVVVRARVEAEADDGTRKDVAILQGTMIPVPPA
ncbi:MAG: PaaI family thioesterase [Pseudomonadota bacterium]